ncbi:hypothetical protein, partial [Streptomyces sp. JHA26]|uniref:hypothetical protein n=1 Tax=Streptomyces sp. JHA26 TaxID=1917143 RepID=UPI001C0C5964
MREAVRFADGITHLSEQGVTSCLELGPDGVLSGMGADTVPEMAFAPVLRKDRDEAASLMEALAQVYVRGHAVDWAALLAPSRPRLVELPTYAFQKERYWVQPAQPATHTSLESEGWRYRVAWSPVTVGSGVLSGAWLVVVPAGLAGDAWVGECVAGLARCGARPVMLELAAGESGREVVAGRLGSVSAGEPGGFAGVVSLLGLASGRDKVFGSVPVSVALTLGLVQALGDV